MSSVRAACRAGERASDPGPRRSAPAPPRAPPRTRLPHADPVQRTTRRPPRLRRGRLAGVQRPWPRPPAAARRRRRASGHGIGVTVPASTSSRRRLISSVQASSTSSPSASAWSRLWSSSAARAARAWPGRRSAAASTSSRSLGMPGAYHTARRYGEPCAPAYAPAAVRTGANQPAGAGAGGASNEALTRGQRRTGDAEIQVPGGLRPPLLLRPTDWQQSACDRPCRRRGRTNVGFIASLEYMRFHGGKHPRQVGAEEVTAPERDERERVPGARALGREPARVEAGRGAPSGPGAGHNS